MKCSVDSNSSVFCSDAPLEQYSLKYIDSPESPQYCKKNVWVFKKTLFFLSKFCVNTFYSQENKLNIDKEVLNFLSIYFFSHELEKILPVSMF